MTDTELKYEAQKERKNELKKELMRSKVEAEFSHYCAGNLYYKVVTADGTFQFPIATVQDEDWVQKTGWAAGENPPVYKAAKLSVDLGTTAFNAKEKASMLWRWIDKAIDAGEFQKVE